LRRRDLAVWPLVVALASAGAVALLRASPSYLFAPCPLRVLTGVPCPTCGGTMAVRELLQGRLLAAFTANPLVVLAILGLLASGVAALLALPWASRIRMPRPPSSRLLVWIAAGLLAANWLYLLFRYL
jgi:hypothetical protein